MPKRYKRNCDVCGNYYHGRGARYCSCACRSNDHDWVKRVQDSGGCFPKGHIPWSKGKHVAMNPKCVQVLRDHIREHGPWNKGVKGSIPRNKTSFTSERVRGANNVNWKGGISDENSRIRSSPEYKEWRMKVFQRDRFSCVLCGYRSHKPKDIRADHIKPFSLYRELRFNMDNGRTLCVPCDLKHGWNSLREINDSINYSTWKFYYHIRKPLRTAIFQALAPPRL